MECVSKICFLEDVEVPEIDKPENEGLMLIVVNEEPLKAEYVSVVHQPLCKNSVFPFGNFVRAVEKAAREMSRNQVYVTSEEGCGRASAVAVAAALARRVDYDRIRTKFTRCNMNYELLVNAIFVGLTLRKYDIDLGVEKLLAGCEGIKGWRNMRELCEIRDEAHKLAMQWSSE